MSMVFCRGCGKEIHESARACPQCGATQFTGGNKNRISAALLAFSWAVSEHINSI